MYLSSVHVGVDVRCILRGEEWVLSLSLVNVPPQLYTAFIL